MGPLAGSCDSPCPSKGFPPSSAAEQGHSGGAWSRSLRTGKALRRDLPELSEIRGMPPEGYPRPQLRHRKPPEGFGSVGTERDQPSEGGVVEGSASSVPVSGFTSVTLCGLPLHPPLCPLDAHPTRSSPHPDPLPAGEGQGEGRNMPESLRLFAMRITWASVRAGRYGVGHRVVPGGTDRHNQQRQGSGSTGAAVTTHSPCHQPRILSPALAASRRL
jgi:hypothetical protein